MDNELKVVFESWDVMNAEITAGMLRANGIEAQVFGQTSSYPSLNATINNVQVKVNADDYDAAIKLLEMQDDNIEEIPDDNTE